MKYIKTYENFDLFINNIFNNLEIIISKIIDKCGIKSINDTLINRNGCIVRYNENDFFLYVPLEERDSLVTQKFRTDRFNNSEYNYNYFNYDDGYFKFFITINQYDIASSIWINNKPLDYNIDINLVKKFIENLNHIVNINITINKYNL